MSDTEKKIEIVIDGKRCEANEGEYILNVARANNIFIPAICYLTRCSPTLACRICLVEADGKQVYACNAKAKDGMEVTVDTPAILEERRAIMEVYDVNHPLQCGVCDKHGECELQNYTLEIGVDSQNYSIRDTKREVHNWSSVLHYDASLCIVCERCTTVCKDMIGDAAITTVKRGGDALDKSLKESMPKDAYAMWNKLQKSIIAPSNGTNETNCSDCGECIAVCPVGALVSRDFMYSANPWDMRRVPATSPHSSDGAMVYYEVKPTSITNRKERIYRVTNEWNFMSLDGSARFAYDFENADAVKDKEAFSKAVEALKQAKTIRFNSLISNEEALILQRLKEKLGLKLVNHEVKPFQEFIRAYQQSSGKRFWSGSIKDSMKSADFVISIGASLRHDSPSSKYLFNTIQKMNKGAGLYCHTTEDSLISGFGKNVESLIYQPGLEEYMLYLILELFGDKDKMPKKVQDFLEEQKIVEKKSIKTKVKKKITDPETNEEKEIEEEIEEQVEVVNSKIAQELGIDLEALNEKLQKMLKKKEKFVMMVGEDLYNHPKVSNLASLVSLVEYATEFDIVAIPPKSNALGVALICELDESEEGFTIGYNEPGDFVLSALGNGDLDMPAFNQQEGSLVSIEKRLLPTNAALDYQGYELNDLASEFIQTPELTVGWTSYLPQNSGFKALMFDDLKMEFANNGEDKRGYLLENATISDASFDSIELPEAKRLEGDIVYRCNPARQFNDFTNKSHEIFEPFGLYVSEEKAKNLPSRVIVRFETGEIEVDVISDPKNKGEIMRLSDFVSSKCVYDLFKANRYAQVRIEGV